MRFSGFSLSFFPSWALPTELCNVVRRSQSGVEENRGLCARCFHTRIIATLQRTKQSEVRMGTVLLMKNLAARQSRAYSSSVLAWHRLSSLSAGCFIPPEEQS